MDDNQKVPDVVLDDGIDPAEVERYGADSRGPEVDVDALRRLAEQDADREEDDA